MKKLFDVIAGMCGICAVIVAMALDSVSRIPTYIFAGCVAYLSLYMIWEMLHAEDITFEEWEGECDE